MEGNGVLTEKKGVVFITSFWDRLKKAFASHPKTFVLIGLGLVGTLLYLNSIHNEFVFDDINLIVKDRRIQSLKNIPDILGLTKFRYSYRPLREVSYAIDYQLTGLNPLGYHLFNIAYHILSSYFVFLIAFHLSKDRKVGLITALLFIAHPIQTESVTYISGRRDILTSLFYFMGFYSFLRFKESSSKRYIIFFFLSYFLSLMSKEMGVTLPALIVLYDLLQPGQGIAESGSVPRKRFLSLCRETLRRNWLLYLGLFLIAISYTFYKVAIRNPSHQEGFYGGTMASNFLTVIGIWVFYLKLLILPLSLNVAHSFPLSKSLFEYRTLCSALTLLFLFALIVKGLEKKALYSFCGLWFFITLLPVSHIFPHHELLAEHYLYLPSLGFVMAIGLLSSHFLKRKPWRPFVYGFLITLFLFYSFLTVQRNLIWKDGYTLWTDASSKSSDIPRVKLNLGTALMRRGEDERAAQIFKELIQNDQKNHQARINLGIIYLQRKDFDQAIEEFKKVIRVRPRYAEAYNNLAMALVMNGDLDGAIEAIREAIRIRPWAEYYFNLGKFYENKGMMPEAIETYGGAIKLNTQFFDAYLHLGVLYSKLDRPQEAVAVLEKALKINPHFGRAHFMLGVNLLRTRDIQKAVLHLEKALQLATNEKDRRAIESVLAELRSPRR
jgi:tetratricopeptide (TPR) repeat protein